MSCKAAKTQTSRDFRIPCQGSVNEVSRCVQRYSTCSAPRDDFDSRMQTSSESLATLTIWIHYNRIFPRVSSALNWAQYKSSRLRSFILASDEPTWPRTHHDNSMIVHIPSGNLPRALCPEYSVLSSAGFWYILGVFMICNLQV